MAHPPEIGRVSKVSAHPEFYLLPLARGATIGSRS
jgi:hypothetical protein